MTGLYLGLPQMEPVMEECSAHGVLLMTIHYQNLM